MLLPHPQVVIPHIQVENVVGPDGLQCFRGLELKEDKSRLDVALLVIGEQEQIVAVVLLHPLGGVPLFEDEPLHVMDAQVRDHVLSRPPFAWAEKLPCHESFRILPAAASDPDHFPLFYPTDGTAPRRIRALSPMSRRSQQKWFGMYGLFASSGLPGGAVPLLHHAEHAGRRGAGVQQEERQAQRTKPVGEAGRTSDEVHARGQRIAGRLLQFYADEGLAV